MGDGNIVTKTDIYGNLRRARISGNIALLEVEDINALAIKHYGILDSNNKLIGYQCPYSGAIITDPKDLVFEHIISISCGGGTVLFNCIPSSKMVNNKDEKGTKDLLAWWLEESPQKSKYFSQDRLEALIDYILEAYDIVFAKYTVEDLERSYTNLSAEEDQRLEENVQKNGNKTEKQFFDFTKQSIKADKDKEIAKRIGTINYLAFIERLIEHISDSSKKFTYKTRLKELEARGVFDNIERISLVQKALTKVIKGFPLSDRNESYLTYLSYIDLAALDKSLKELTTSDELEDEIKGRLFNIDKILLNNNMSIISFFEDASNKEIFYKKTNDITKEEIESFIQSINMCVADKFNKLVDFVTEYGKLPSKNSNGEDCTISNEYDLACFVSNLKSVKKKEEPKVMNTALNETQLKYLCNSRLDPKAADVLKNLYITILTNALRDGVIDEKGQGSIAYVEPSILAEIVSRRERTFSKIGGGLQKHDDQLSDLVDFVTEYGKLPSRNSNKKDRETLKQNDLADFVSDISRVREKKEKKVKVMVTALNETQLKYLFNSSGVLRDLYDKIMEKAYNNNVINYIEMDKSFKEKGMIFSGRQCI